MGKARRARTKFHITSVQGDFDDICSSDFKLPIRNDAEISNDFTKNVESDFSKKNGTDLDKNSSMETDVGEWKVVPDDDLFKNVDIDVDKLETSVKVENSIESRPTNISISKCIKRSVAGSGINLKLKKGDRRELRRNLFIKKIDAIHEIMKKKSKKVKRPLAEVDGKKQTYEIQPEKTFQEMIESPKVRRPPNESSNTKHLPTSKISKRKQKTMSKKKNNAQEMLKNIDFYNQIIADKKYQTDAMGVVTNAVQKKVYADL